MLFHLLSKLNEHTSVVIMANLGFSVRSRVFGDAKMATALLVRLTHHSQIMETGIKSSVRGFVTKREVVRSAKCLLICGFF